MTSSLCGKNHAPNRALKLALWHQYPLGFYFRCACRLSGYWTTGRPPSASFFFSLHARFARAVLPSSQGTLAHICPALRPRPDPRARPLALRCCSRRHSSSHGLGCRARPMAINYRAVTCSPTTAGTSSRSTTGNRRLCTRVVRALQRRMRTLGDDFSAAGEWLIANGYTRSERLAIDGRSNGGLLVPAWIWAAT